MMFRYFAIFIISFFTVYTAAAQKTSVVSAVYTYILSDDDSPTEGKRIAIERAKIQAIAEKFGTLVSQTNVTYIKNENGESVVDFTSLGGSEVKGEWIEDLMTPVTEISMENDMIAIKATVKGRAREIVRAEVDIIVNVLRNGITQKHASEIFLSGNDMYLHFRTPQNGYLAVYLSDGENVFTLLPYQNSPHSARKVKKDKDYILFHTESSNDEERLYVDEYVLTASKEVEINHIYVVFSPNEFVKANVEASNSLTQVARSSQEVFEEWIANNKKRDADMQVVVKSIEIRNSD